MSSNIQLTRETSASIPAASSTSQARLFIDSADGILKIKDSGGVSIGVGAFAAFPGATVASPVIVGQTLVANEILPVGSIVGPINFDLPALSGVLDGADLFAVVDINGLATTHNISITPNGTETINGVNSPISLVDNYGIRGLIKTSTTNWTIIYGDPSEALAHASSHLSGFSDELDGDRLDIDLSPTYYAQDTTPSEVTLNSELTAHLKGIDNALGFANRTFYVKNDAELTAALTSIGTAGGQILLAAGDYTLASINEDYTGFNVSIIGSGPDTALTCNGGIALIADSITLQNFKVFGNNSDVDGVYISSASEVHVSGLRVSGFGSIAGGKAGLHLENCTEITIESSFFSGQGDSTGADLFVENGQNFSINGVICNSSAVSEGIKIATNAGGPSPRGSISNFAITPKTKHGILLAHTNGLTPEPADVVVSNGWIYGCGWTGLHCDSGLEANSQTGRGIISNVFVQRCGGANGSGINGGMLLMGAHGFKLSNNWILESGIGTDGLPRANASPGIDLQGSRRADISNNHVGDSTGTNIAFTSTTQHSSETYYGDTLIQGNITWGGGDVEISLSSRDSFPIRRVSIKDNHLSPSDVGGHGVLISGNSGTVQNLDIQVTHNQINLPDGVTGGRGIYQLSGSMTGSITHNRITCVGTPSDGNGILISGSPEFTGTTLAVDHNEIDNLGTGIDLDLIAGEVGILEGNRISNTISADYSPSGGTLYHGRRRTEDGGWEIEADAIPVEGTWSVGDRIWRRTPSLTSPAGYVCITAGAPGTWVDYGYPELVSTFQTVDATPTIIATYTTTTNDALYLLDLSITAIDKTENHAFERGVRTVIFRDEGGTLTVKNTNNYSTYNEDGTWNTNVLVSGSDIQLQVTGDAANNVEWTVKGTVKEQA